VCVICSSVVSLPSVRVCLMYGVCVVRVYAVSVWCVRACVVIV